MITDEQFEKLQKEVVLLKKRITELANQYDRLLMGMDTEICGTKTKPEKNSDRNRKDITKYEFRGNKYCKRKLVLACVKCYVEENNISRGDMLEEIFPDYVQGSLGVVKTVEKAEWYADASKRFCFADDDIIRLSDGNYVVCSQWETKNIENFLTLAADLGYEIKPITRKYDNR